MSFLSSLIGGNNQRSGESVISIKNPPSWFVKMMGGGPTSSGIDVDEKVALTLSAVYSAVDIISKVIATMPIHLNRRINPRGKAREDMSPLYAMVHDAPNDEQTAYAWKRLTINNMLLWGVGASEIEFVNGKPAKLWPIPPWRLRPMRSKTKKTGRYSLYYEFTDVDGSKIEFAPWQLLVFSTMQTDDKFLSPIGVHRETIGAALAVREYGAKTFGSGINPAGILSGLRFSDEDTEESISQKYTIPYQGLNGNKRLMLLEENVKFERIGLPPEDAQYLETRKADIADIARIYGIPLYMLAEIDKQTSWGTGVEEQKNGFMTFTTLPICTQVEQELNKKLLKNDPQLFYEFLMSGIMRGVLKDRVEAYYKRWQMGSLSPDDIRDFENENPLPDGTGNVYLVPVNMQSIEFAKDKPEKTNSYQITQKGGDNA
jgi:HK97 family phage portal protein